MGIFRKRPARSDTGAPIGNPTTPPVPGRTYLVARGDSLWNIAKREYGDPRWWYEIFTANRRLLKPNDLIHPGMTLRLP